MTAAAKHSILYMHTTNVQNKCKNARYTNDRRVKEKHGMLSREGRATYPCRIHRRRFGDRCFGGRGDKTVHIAVI